MLNVLIMAGASRRGELEERENVDNKAFIEINNITILEIILKTLQEVDQINKIVIVGPEDKLQKLQEKGSNFELVAQQGDFLDNIVAGMQALDPDQPCIATSADIPLLNAEAVEDFISRCRPFGHDFYYPILSRKNCENKYPQMKRTYMRLKEGVYTGGNLFIIKPHWVLNKKQELDRFLSYRKRPWKLVQMLPFILIAKYLLGRLSIHEVEKFGWELLQIKVAALETPYVEMGVDVDKPEDLDLIKNILSEF